MNSSTIPDPRDKPLPGLAEIGYDFSNKNFLIEALTHKSWAVEKGLSFDNQRLEFFGDAVIQIVVTEYIFSLYPLDDEGRLTKMRSALNQQKTLAHLAGQISLGEFIRMGKGELNASGQHRISTLCDAFEAVAGAIYLDGGIAAARNFLLPLLNTFYPSPEDLLSVSNPKGFLQEYSQKHIGEKPEYKIEKTSGPEHKKNFTVSVSLQGKILGTGTANSKKTAESIAAEDALKKLGAVYNPAPQDETAAPGIQPPASDKPAAESGGPQA